MTSDNGSGSGPLDVDVMSQVRVEPDTDVLAVRPPDAARILGVGERTLRKWHSGGLMPRGMKIGRVLVWSRAELSRWVEAGCPPRPEWERIENRTHGKSPQAVQAKATRQTEATA